MNILISHIYQLIPTLPIIALDDLEELCRCEEGSELVEAIVAWIEVRLLLLYESSDIPEECPSIIVREVRDRISDKIDDTLIDGVEHRSTHGLQIGEGDDLLSFLRFYGRCFGFLGLLLQDLDIDELITGDDEWLRCLLLPHTIDCHPGFT